MSALIIIIATIALAVVSYKFGYTFAVEDHTKKWNENFNWYYRKGHHDCIDSFVSCGIMNKTTGEKLKRRLERRIEHMRKEIILNKKDIEQIIAEKFGENPRNVKLNIVDTCEGYGMAEVYVKTVEAVVTCQEK